MEYDQYVQLTTRAAQHFEANECEAALAIFRKLIESDLADLDKSLMCANMARVLEKLTMHKEALSALDLGIRFESPYFRFFVLEQKGAYLSRLGRNQECLDLYQTLLPQPHLMEGDKVRIRENIKNLQNQLSQEPGGNRNH